MSAPLDMAEEMSAAAVKAFEEAEAAEAKAAEVGAQAPQAPQATQATQATQAAEATVEKVANASSGLSKKMTIGPDVIKWHHPQSEAGKKETNVHTQILTYYGMESLTEEKRKEMLLALYHGTCQTHQTILQSAHCEPVRAILQTLAMKWLSGLVPDETRTTLNTLNGARWSQEALTQEKGKRANAAQAATNAADRDTLAAAKAQEKEASDKLLGSLSSPDASLLQGNSAPPAPYYYYTHDGYIFITTNESTRALCADLASMGDLEYRNTSFLHEEAAVAVKAFEEDDDPNHSDDLSAIHASNSAELTRTQATQQTIVAEQDAQRVLREAQRVLQDAKQQQDARAITAAQAALSAAQAQVEAAQAEVATARAATRAATEQSQQNAARAQAATEQLAALTAEHTRSREELAAARASLVALEALGEQVGIANRDAHAAAEDRIRAAEGRVQAIQAQVAAQVADKNARIEEIGLERARERNDSLAALEQARANAAASAANVAQLRAELTAAQAQAEANRGNKNTEITQLRTEKAAEVARLRTELAEARAESTAHAAARVAAQEAAHVAAEAHAAEQQSQADAAAASVAALQEQLARAQQNIGNRSATHVAEVAAMRRQLAAAQAEAATQLSAAQEAHQRAIEAAQAAAVAAVAAAVAEAQAQAEEAAQAAAQAQAEAVSAAKAEAEAAAAQQATRQATFAAQEAQRIEADAAARVTALRAELAAAESGQQNLLSQKNRSNAARIAAQAEVAWIREQLSRATEESAAANEQTAEAQAAVVSTRAASERAVQEATAARADAEQARAEATQAQTEAEAARAAQARAEAAQARAEADATEAAAARNVAQREAAESAELARLAQEDAAAQTAAALQAQQQAEEAMRAVTTATAAKEVAATEVLQLTRQLEAAQQAATQAGTNRNQSRNQSRLERNAAGVEVARIQEQLSLAQAETAAAQQRVDAARVEKEQADEQVRIAEATALAAALAAQAEVEKAREEAKQARENAATNVATIRAEKNAANAARTAALQEAEQNKAALRAELKEARDRSEEAERIAQESTTATQAQQERWQQEANAAAAKQEEIQAELAAATARATELTQAHAQAISNAQAATAAVSIDRNAVRQQVAVLEAEKIRIQLEKTAQQQRLAQITRETDIRIAELEREIQQRNTTLHERNQTEARVAADLLAAHQQALNEKNQVIAAAQANRNAAQANRSAVQAERNTARLELKQVRNDALAEQQRLLQVHKQKLDEIDAEREEISQRHEKALQAGQTAYAKQLQERLEKAEREHARVLTETIERADAATISRAAAVEADKQAQQEAFAQEKAQWEAEMVEVNRNREQLVAAARVALDKVAIAEREKKEAMDEAAASIAAAEALAASAQSASHANRAAMRDAIKNAMMAQREAEEKAKEAEEKMAAAQETAHLASEAAQQASADATAAKDAQEGLERKQAQMMQATQELQATLAAAERAHQEARARVVEDEQARAANSLALNQTAAERVEWAARTAELEAAVAAAMADAAAKQKDADALQASLAAKELEYGAAQREAEETLAAAQREKEELEDHHREEIKGMKQKVEESTQRVNQISKEIESARTESTSIQEQLKQEHAAVKQAALQEQAVALQAKMEELRAAQQIEIETLKSEKQQTVAALQQSITTHEAMIVELTARKDAAEQGHEEATQAVKEKEREIEGLTMQFEAAHAQLQHNKNRNVMMAMESNKILIQNAIEEAEREKKRADNAILLNKVQMESAMKQILKITTEKVDLERQLQQVTAAMIQRHGVIDLSAVPAPNVSFAPASQKAVSELIGHLIHRYFLPWRTLLRHPVALRVFDLEVASLSEPLRTCLQTNPLVFLFSPLPDERVMETLLGNAYDEYEHEQESVANASQGASSAPHGASSASSGGGGNAMRIDILLYYLIMGLRQAPITNSSSYMGVMNATVERINTFHTEHYEKNKANLERIENSCGLELANKHNQDPSLLTFLYLSSKTPGKGNARFQYEIDRYQKSLKMTYSSTPTALYDATGEETKQGEQGGDRRTYHYGPFTKIYGPTMTSRDISQDKTFVDAVENKLRRGEAVTVIGYGASGSGKTTTLVYAKHNGQPGLLAHVANRLIKPSDSVNGYTSCEVIIYELDADESATPKGQCRAILKDSQQTLTRTVLDKEGRAQTYTIPVSDCSRAQPFSYTIQGDTWVSSANSNTLLEREIVEYIDTKRNTAPTPNNPQSSRSHVICVLTFSKAAGDANAAGNAVFIVCDFAGVENTFMCEDPRVRETIGVKALINPMVKMKEDDVKAFMRNNIQDVREGDFVLKDHRSSYLFGEDTHEQGSQSSRSKLIAAHIARHTPIAPRNVFNIFTDIENDCRAMYKLMDAKFSLKISGFTNFKDITRDSHPQGGLSNNLDVYKDFKESYQRILTLYQYHTTTYVNDGSGRMVKIKKEIEESDKVDEVGLLWHLAKILVWYKNSRIRYETLFQSLMTYAYHPDASTIMSKTQMEEYPQRALCDQRVKEGVFINDSLKRLRSFIATRVRGTSRTPPFLDECVPLQCHPHHLHCFGQGSREEDGGPLARLIEKSVVGKTNTFCIFTVVNLSRDANNPPPTPYVDIEPLLTLRESLYPLIPGKMDLPASDALRTTLNGVYKNLELTRAEGDIVRQFTTYATRILQGGDDVPYHLEDLIQMLISHNAITTIGTIEFTDSMAKYGATQITCAPSFVKGQVRQIDQRGGPSVYTTERRGQVNQLTRSGLITPTTRFASVALGGSTRVRRKANRRTRKKRNT